MNIPIFIIFLIETTIYAKLLYSDIAFGQRSVLNLIWLVVTLALCKLM